MNAALRDFIRRRAQHRCEYCRLAEADAQFATFQIEHIIAVQHGGTDEDGNLALACPRCNLCKGPNIAGLDPLDNALKPLFHPRNHVWEEHFTFFGPVIVGLTAIGRTTIRTLNMNDPVRVDLRAAIGGRPDR